MHTQTIENFQHSHIFLGEAHEKKRAQNLDRHRSVRRNDGGRDH